MESGPFRRSWKEPDSIATPLLNSIDPLIARVDVSFRNLEPVENKILGFRG